MTIKAGYDLWPGIAVKNLNNASGRSTLATGITCTIQVPASYHYSEWGDGQESYVITLSSKL